MKVVRHVRFVSTRAGVSLLPTKFELDVVNSEIARYIAATLAHSDQVDHVKTAEWYPRALYTPGVPSVVLDLLVSGQTRYEIVEIICIITTVLDFDGHMFKLEPFVA